MALSIFESSKTSIWNTDYQSWYRVQRLAGQIFVERHLADAGLGRAIL